MAKTVLITGASLGGIGASLARELKRQGWRVFATARKVETVTELAALGIETLPLEVTKQDSVDALKAEVDRRTGGKLDMLINNAGRNYTVPATEVVPEEVEETFRTNVFGVMALCKAFTPLLIEAKGTIVQIGSVAGIIPYVFGSVYNASKAALHSYSETLRVELEPFDVRVVVVVTGGVKSNIARTKRVLQDDSLYLPISAEYNRRITHSQANGVDTDLYARGVVKSLLSWRQPNTIWAGGASTLIWFVSTFLPKSVFRFVMSRMFQLWRLRSSPSIRKTQ